VELGNARGTDGEICPFEPGIQQVVQSLCKLAAVALESYLRQQKLKNQVRELAIQIDESKKTRQVREIVETSYFKTLKSRARELRAQNAAT
jgi:GAF domain-containing protein